MPQFSVPIKYVFYNSAGILVENHYGILIENWFIAEPFGFFKFMVPFTGSFAKCVHYSEVKVEDS